jgi:hypothetical protein
LNGWLLLYPAYNFFLSKISSLQLLLLLLLRFEGIQLTAAAAGGGPNRRLRMPGLAQILTYSKAQEQPERKRRNDVLGGWSGPGRFATPCFHWI